MSWPEYKVVLTPLTDEAQEKMGFKWADPHIGTRSKVGGSPDFLQDHEVQVCPSCGTEMTFIAQIDSIGDEMTFADVGMLYVFVCFDCFKTSAFVQSG